MLLTLLLSLFTFVELNTENLFDCKHDSLKADTEFLPSSYRHWTPYRYWRKLNRVGQTIIACGEHDGSYTAPDMVALLEVENDSVLFDLTKRSTLRMARYEYVMTDSPDERGIDVALLYSPFSFRLLSHCSIRIPPMEGLKPTRDILYVKGQTIDDDTLHVFVVHAPSRSGGELETRRHRMHVARRLLSSVDSIRTVAPDARIIVAGDFNDTNKDASVTLLESNGLRDVTKGVKGTHGAKATYRYRGLWQSLDHVFCSPMMADRVVEAAVGDFPFLLEEDEKYGGRRPKPTYQGMKYHDGFSDHLPLVVRFR